MRRRLRRDGIDEAEIEVAVEQLRRHRFVDDAAFAEYWVAQRQTFHPRGARMLRAELAQRGVARALVEEATAPNQLSEAEDAYRAAARRASQLGGLDARAFQARLGAFLARRGFDWDTVGSVVERLWAEAQP